MSDERPLGPGSDSASLTAERPEPGVGRPNLVGPADEPPGDGAVFPPSSGSADAPWQLVAPAPLSGDGGWLVAGETTPREPAIGVAGPADRAGVRPPPLFQPDPTTGRVERPVRVHQSNQGWPVRLGDHLAAPLVRHRRQTITLLSLIVLVVLCYVAIGELNLFGAGG